MKALFFILFSFLSILQAHSQDASVILYKSLKQFGGAKVWNNFQDMSYEYTVLLTGSYQKDSLNKKTGIIYHQQTIKKGGYSFFNSYKESKQLFGVMVYNPQRTHYISYNREGDEVVNSKKDLEKNVFFNEDTDIQLIGLMIYNAQKTDKYEVKKLSNTVFENKECFRIFVKEKVNDKNEFRVLLIDTKNYHLLSVQIYDVNDMEMKYPNISYHFTKFTEKQGYVVPEVYTSVYTPNNFRMRIKSVSENTVTKVEFNKGISEDMFKIE